MFKKKNKNLHRALIALMVLGLLVCLCFTLASAATAEPDSSSAAETTAAEEQGAQSNTEAMTNFLNQAGIATLIHNADWKSIVMILISFVLMYLAIGKGFEPLLLLPIAFGMLLTNLPGAGMFHSEIFEGGHIHWDLIKNGVTLSNGANEAAGLIDILYLGVKLGIYPCLIFMGVGAMTDFGPLIANPRSFLLGAAAQLGCNLHARARMIAYIQPAFIQTERLHLAGILGVHGAHAAGIVYVFFAVWRQKNQIGALFKRAANGFARAHATFLGWVALSQNDAVAQLPLPADRHRPPAQFRMAQQLDARIAGVDIRM